MHYKKREGLLRNDQSLYKTSHATHRHHALQRTVSFNIPSHSTYRLIQHTVSFNTPSHSTYRLIQHTVSCLVMKHFMAGRIIGVRYNDWEDDPYSHVCTNLTVVAIRGYATQRTR